MSRSLPELAQEQNPMRPDLDRNILRGSAPEGRRDAPWVDFHLQGLLRVRLVDPAPQDLASLRALLGEPLPEPLSESRGQPDITVRFQEMATPPQLTYLGLHWAGFTQEEFFLLDGKGRAQAAIPMDQLGQACTIRCQRGTGIVPLLHEILALSFLAKGWIPVHGSAFRFRGKGVLALGWTKGGKTESLLAFASQGAEYVGDEVVLLAPDGGRMFGLPVPISVWEWQLRQIPQLLPGIPAGKRLLFQAVRLLGALHRAGEKLGLAQRFPLDLLGRALPSLERQRRLVLHPERLFPGRIHAGMASVDRIFLLLSRAQPGIQVTACSGQEVARRMVHSNLAELFYFQEFHRAFRFAFPERANPFLEEIPARQAAGLARALAGKSAHRVVHPYPVSLRALYQAMEPWVGDA